MVYKKIIERVVMSEDGKRVEEVAEAAEAIAEDTAEAVEQDENGNSIEAAEQVEDDSATEEALRTEKVKERIIELAEATSDNPLSFAQLDFQTVKPYIQPVNILLYVGAAGFLTFATGSLLLGAVAGLLLGTLYLGYPFAIDTKYSSHEIYTEAGISKVSMFVGRYLFSFIFSLVVAASSVVAARVGMHFTRSDLDPFPYLSIFEGLGAMMLIYWVIMVIQLAFYFRFGYVKARLVGTLPLLAATAIIGSVLIGS